MRKGQEYFAAALCSSTLTISLENNIGEEYIADIPAHNVSGKINGKQISIEKLPKFLMSKHAKKEFNPRTTELTIFYEN